LNLNPSFSPTQTYTLEFANYFGDMTAVSGGGSFLANFALYNTSRTLATNGNDLTVQPTASQALYAITGDTLSGFMPDKAGTPLTAAPCTTIQQALDSIAKDASRLDCFIQLGNGTDTLHLGTANNIAIDGTKFGKITLTGKASSISTSATLVMSNFAHMESQADIMKTTSNYLINVGNGTFWVSAGNLTSGAASCVYITTGTGYITGGTISSAANAGVFLSSTGMVNISGGTITANNYAAVYNSGGGKISISGTAVISSAYTSTTYGAVYNNSTGSIEIKGGTISNTATG
jgi:hypothetical protein